ncbi:tRNA (adenosine(37)-N6)-dimethylallyltransferase MiaA [Gammaproteobacteria bacterium]|nr:tRNA (adenosine(37)-N6)-dimethylallyltransferase MiaA [Gammaproteobacteria bacterium]
MVFLFGPTASGKTDLAVQLVDKFPIEIISVDSVMVYKDCDIGSAKPGVNILKKYPHHLIDMVSPNEIFTVAEFCKFSKKIIKKIHNKDKLPLFVGGSMMYFKSLYEGIHNLPLRDEIYRKELKKINYNDRLYSLLNEIDPAYAARLNKNDEVRIIRALEIHKNTGKTYSQILKENIKVPITDEYEVFQFGIIDKRSLIHERIKQRLDNIILMGLEDEAKKILEKYDMKDDHPIRKSVNYKQIFDFIEGKDDFDSFKDKALFATRQLAKKQDTWLRSWKMFTKIKINESTKLENNIKKALSLL